MEILHGALPRLAALQQLPIKILCQGGCYGWVELRLHSRCGWQRNMKPLSRRSLTTNIDLPCFNTTPPESFLNPIFNTSYG
jgi:hypothetical protein